MLRADEWLARHHEERRARQQYLDDIRTAMVNRRHHGVEQAMPAPIESVDLDDVPADHRRSDNLTS